MKQQDATLIIVVVFVSAVFALLVSKAVVASPQKRQQQVEVVQPISAEFPVPDSHYFNKNAVDPTKVITVGNSANPDPFSGASSSSGTAQ